MADFRSPKPRVSILPFSLARRMYKSVLEWYWIDDTTQPLGKFHRVAFNQIGVRLRLDQLLYTHSAASPQGPGNLHRALSTWVV